MCYFRCGGKTGAATKGGPYEQDYRSLQTDALGRMEVTGPPVMTDVNGFPVLPPSWSWQFTGGGLRLDAYSYAKHGQPAPLLHGMPPGYVKFDEVGHRLAGEQQGAMAGEGFVSHCDQIKSPAVAAQEPAEMSAQIYKQNTTDGDIDKEPGPCHHGATRSIPAIKDSPLMNHFLLS